MGRCKDLSEEKIAGIKALLQHSDHSQRQIAALCGISQASVKRVAQKLKDGAPTKPQRAGRCGRNKKVTPRAERKLIRIVKENRWATTGEVRQMLEASGCNISHRTVRRSLYELDFKSRRPVKKPRLTPKMIEARQRWAHSYRNFTEDDWNMVSNHYGVFMIK